MKVKVLRVEDGGREALMETDAGQATLRVHSKPGTPSAGRTYSAELSVQDALVLGKNAWLAEERAYLIERRGTDLALVGLVDGVDEDGLVYLRLGSDALVMIEAAPQEIVSGSWLRVIISAEKVTLYLS